MTSSVYVHVPFCASRCGYCDFNTYTAHELGSGVRRETFHETLIAEIRQTPSHLRGEIDTVFFGGGTPSLLGAPALNAILNAIRTEFGLAKNAEVTSEANPDGIDAQLLAGLRAGGFTRMSFGMQSSAPHVLQVLDRTHTPGASTRAVQWAKDAGFEHINLDLIYGTPGETDDDLRATLDDVLASGVDHVSAYGLIIEEGTALARRVAKGELASPDDDIAADRYTLVDETLRQAGLPWYEICNWARPGGECRHNMAYWQSHDWLGIGPGAHSHVQGQRWWNLKNPASYAAHIVKGESAEAEREILTHEQQRFEQLMLRIRTREGIARDDIAADIASELESDGLVRIHDNGRLLLTRRGRLLADAVVRTLTTETAELGQSPTPSR